ncbi:MAG: O-antigen ligase family protein [Chloroflexi bacterium]|nr:O-antigen ligase family protein [Chloroflexota bacterium]
MAYQSPVVVNSIGHARAVPANRVYALFWALAPYGAFGCVLLAVGLLAGISHERPMVIGTIMGFLILAPVMWYRPALGAYILVAGAAAFETFPLGFPDSITDESVFFQAFRTAGGPGFMAFNAAEMIMGFSLATIILRRIAARERPLRLGPMIGALGFYSAMVVFGLLHGIGTGGNLTAAIWEARGQFYLLLTYLIVVNSLTSKSQVKRLMWLFIIVIALKGILGSWRFLVTLGGSLENMEQISRNTNSLLAHEESYFFALMFIFAFILFMFRSHRGQLTLILIASAPALFAFLVNQRRSGTLMLILGLIIAAFLSFYLLKGRRKLIAAFVVAGAVIAPVFMAATWNSTNIIAEPTQAVRSVFAPNVRDEASNTYRDIENIDLIYNIQIDPFQGQGYGREIIFFIPLPAISHEFFWWDIIPHNNVLWVWFRLGFIGFAAFWFLVGRAISGSILVTKRLSDPYLQSVGVFVVVSLVTWTVMGFLDMGLVDFRETTLMGALIGIVALLPKMERAAEGEQATATRADD